MSLLKLLSRQNIKSNWKALLLAHNDFFYASQWAKLFSPEFKAQVLKIVAKHPNDFSFSTHSANKLFETLTFFKSEPFQENLLQGKIDEEAAQKLLLKFCEVRDEFLTLSSQMLAVFRNINPCSDKATIVELPASQVHDLSDSGQAAVSPQVQKATAVKSKIGEPGLQLTVRVVEPSCLEDELGCAISTDNQGKDSPPQVPITESAMDAFFLFFVSNFPLLKKDSPSPYSLLMEAGQMMAGLTNADWSLGDSHGVESIGSDVNTHFQFYISALSSFQSESSDLPAVLSRALQKDFKTLCCRIDVSAMEDGQKKQACIDDLVEKEYQSILGDVREKKFHFTTFNYYSKEVGHTASMVVQGLEDGCVRWVFVDQGPDNSFDVVLKPAQFETSVKLFLQVMFPLSLGDKAVEQFSSEAVPFVRDIKQGFSNVDLFRVSPLDSVKGGYCGFYSMLHCLRTMMSSQPGMANRFLVESLDHAQEFYKRVHALTEVEYLRCLQTQDMPDMLSKDLFDGCVKKAKSQYTV